MKILAVDTSTTSATAAITEGSRLVAEFTLNISRAHSQRIMGIIDELFKKSDYKLADIDLFACSAGPGSFTGLRIGASVIKGMAQTFKKPVAAVPTLDALAYSLYNCTGLVCPILDAQRQMVYSNLYCWEKGRLKRLENIGVIGIGDLMELIGKRDLPVTFLGDGVELYEKNIKDSLEEYYTAGAGSLLPRASSCAAIAMDMYERGEVGSYDTFRLTYIRRSQAEVEYEKKQEVLLQDMSIEDIDQVWEIEKLSFKTPWSRESFMTELSGNNLARYVVAKAGGKVVAYGGMWIVLDEGHITNIAVHPDYRGRGIGERLVLSMLDKARSCQALNITLEVRTSNTAARNLYKKLGFVDSGIRRGYYSDTGEDAVIMWKRLT